MWTDVSEERMTSIFRIENQPSKEPACSRWLEGYIPEDSNIHNHRCKNLKSYVPTKQSLNIVQFSAVCSVVVKALC
jgi:hypothetical protein